jgi:tetratricopeptide (TPR) repeat protein
MEFSRKKIQNPDEVEIQIKIETQTASAEEYVQQGKAYFEKGDYLQAIRLFTQALELEASQADVYYLRGLAYQQTNDIEATLKDFTQAIRLDSGNADYYFRRGLVYFQKGSYEVAVFDFTNAIKSRENEPVFHYQRALGYEQLRQTDNLWHDLNIVLQLDSKHEVAYFKRACIFLIKKNLPEAKRDFEQVKRLNPERTQECELKLLEYLANDEEYQRFQRIAEEQAHKEAEAQTFRLKGDEFLSNKKYSQALQNYEKAIAVNPTDYKAYLGKGQVHYYLGDTVSSIACFNKATELDSVALQDLVNLGLNAGLNTLADSLLRKFFR